jgi:lipopolysaccharide export system protein LptA
MRISGGFYNSSAYNTGLKFFFHTLLILCLLLFHLVSAGAEQTEKPDNIPIHISSDKMLAGLDPNIVIFIGNVEAVRDNSTLFADSMKVYFTVSGEKDLQNRISKIIATGNVRYIADDKRAFSDQAIYMVNDGTLVLEGKSTRLETGKSFITGNKITIFRQEEKIIVESASDKRVQATLQADDSHITKE